MKKHSYLWITLLLLTLLITALASCGKDPVTTDSTAKETQGGLPNTTTAAETTEPPAVTTPEETTVITTEKPREPATPGLTYTSLGNGLCSVSGILDASATKLVIPEKNSKGEFVVSIEREAFANNKMIEEVLIYGAGESVESSAFYNCTALKKVTLESETRSIASSAFRSCTALTEVNLGGNLSSLEAGAFYGCTALSVITVAEGNETFRAEGNCLIAGDTLVLGCSGSVIPTSVTAIGTLAFDGMNLSTLILPATVKTVGEMAFSNNPLTSVSLPEGLETLGDAAFMNCAQLKSVSFPASLKTVGLRIFQACPRVESITVAKENPVYRADGVCLIETATDTVVLGVRLSIVPDGVKKIAPYAFYGAMIPSVTLPEGVTEIGERAFYNCSYMTALTLPASLTSLADDAFGKCSTLTAITYGGSEAEWTTLTATATLPADVTVTCLKEDATEGEA